jgi:hypothetical protein
MMKNKMKKKKKKKKTNSQGHRPPWNIPPSGVWICLLTRRNTELKKTKDTRTTPAPYGRPRPVCIVVLASPKLLHACEPGSALLSFFFF